MIKFACHCKHVLELPEEMAGQQVQCPSCLRLVDVPTHNELEELSEDGTFRIDEPPEQHAGDFETMRVVFAKEKVDENGLEIDLRQTQEQFEAAGTEDNINEFEVRPTAPKYDPETGELVRPLDIVEDPTIAPHPSEAPAATTTLNYARPDLQESGSLTSPLIQLLSPINLAAMFFVLLFHLFFFFASIIPFLTVVGIFFVGPGIIGHYANVIEEVGIEERDELPRFLRHFNITDDIWLPFAHVFLAWMACFGATWILSMVWVYHHWPRTGGMAAASILDIIGLIFFPAVVLTTTTSGSLLNLRPDRILRVIILIGPRYAFLVILYAVAIAFYAIGMVSTPIQAFLFITNARNIPLYFTGPVAYGMLIVGIFLMHYFAWLLGLAYRKLHQKFPWVYHQHERVIPGVTAPRYAKSVRGFPVQPPRLQEK